jgi:hypothetical protein
MTPPLASVTDLERRLGKEFGDAELSRVEAVLDDASALIRDEAGRTWIDPITGLIAGVPASIRAVVLRVAERATRNPDALKSESGGDYSYQYADTEGGVYLTDRERQIIRRALGRTGLWTQPVERGDILDSTLWCEDNYGCELFPLTQEGD